MSNDVLYRRTFEPDTARLVSVPDVRRPAQCKAPAMGRKLVLVDLDNVTGMRDLTVPEWRAILRGIWVELGITTDDQVIISTCRRTLARAMTVLATVPAQLLARDGQDGAEIALREAVDIQHASARFETLVLVSGDHFFAEMVREAHQHGMYVWQVSSTRAGCAMALRRAADLHSELNPDQLLANTDTRFSLSRASALWLVPPQPTRSARRRETYPKAS